MLNDPVNLIDPEGQAGHIALGAVIGGIASFANAYASGVRDYGELAKHTAIGTLFGGLSAAIFNPAIAASFYGGIADASLVGALSGGLGNASSQGILLLDCPKAEWSTDSFLAAMGAGAFGGFAGWIMGANSAMVTTAFGGMSTAFADFAVQRSIEMTSW